MLRALAIFLIGALIIVNEVHCKLRPKVLGGRDAYIEEFPHMVSIRYNDEHFCGGAIISTRHILTAAHCFFDDDMKVPESNYDTLKVVSGSNDLANGGNVHLIKDIITHPKFINSVSYSWINDVAVLVLDSEIKLSPREAIIELPTEETKENSTARISGWSVVAERLQDQQQILQTINVKIVPRNQCRTTLIQKHVNLLPNQICGLFKKGTGICYNDSGSPLVQNGKVIGIVSWKVRCASGYPDVYTNVYRYLDFINNAMK